MTLQRLNELRFLANKHKDSHQSAKHMLELIQEVERLTRDNENLRRLYALALEFGWSDRRSQAIAFSKLKALAGKE